MKRRLPAVAIFLGAFLLFGVQPMLGRTLLPSFGGTAAVWTVCLAAFQTLLLAGYFYAHMISRKPVRAQRILHAALLALAVVWTGTFAVLRPLIRGRLGESGQPVLEVLFCVLLFAGLPYVLLSANSTLIQAWLAKSSDSRGVYRLYAVSNLGSFCGLLAYPLLVEPYVSLTAQWWGFAAGLVVYAVLLWRTGKEAAGRRLEGTSVCSSGQADACPSPGTVGSADQVGSAGVPADKNTWLWFVLSAASCFLLNAVTTYLSNDITPFPLLWIILLGIYLCSYIGAFSAFGERSAGWWGVLTLVGVVALAFAMRLEKAVQTLPIYLPLGVTVLLFGGMFLHGWLYRVRPAPAALTRYYLLIAAGGAVGGVAASVVAPLIFSQIWEFPVALLLLALLAALYFARPDPATQGVKREAVWLLAGVAVLLVVGDMRHQAGQVILAMRNFYGTSRLVNTTARTAFGDVLTARALRHGSVTHGIQYREAYLRDKPTTYYGASGGGLAFSLHTNRVTETPLRVGLIGLGIGTLACHGRTGDLFRFYEINPQVVAIATDTNHFTYLSDSLAKVEIVLGDARKSLERECAEGEPLLDVIVLDAYSGDAVPLHLTTREAIDLYLRRLAPNGILAAHITNWHIDLSVLCKAIANEFGLYIESALSPARAPLDYEAYWVFFSRVPLARAKMVRRFDWEHIPDMALPTDDKGHITRLIRLSYDPQMEAP